ncbi:cytochrome c oxidase subunit 4 [Streptomyces sp. WAC 00631]|uniref:aa3-type cytochrome oxidase subunit IV n=1 Tax=unclassified Streptomyces TaxID=2593676 RepID=UPI000F78A42F|nr:MULTISPECIES: cytochrome c oxidase subunit 4 [unclassified Streptomyces]MCC5033661.1 cytochrome c oxidase subunit 4 [Streptomyces sp. WAC 00631]MCC9742947.1 cytochrome c oxidase subunit 4 [Streptomyces sp. MNU89]
MKTEALVFTGVAGFFGVVTAVYVVWGSLEPAGTAVLTLSFVMSALVSLFLWIQYRQRGLRPQDRRQAAVHEAAGPLAFFSPRSYYPVLTAAGAALLGVGVVYGLWLFLVGVGVLIPGIAGFVFQHNDR